MSELKYYAHRRIQEGVKVLYRPDDIELTELDAPEECYKIPIKYLRKDGTVLLEVVAVNDVYVTTYINGFDDNKPVSENYTSFTAKVVRAGNKIDPRRILRVKRIVGFPDTTA